MKYIGRSVYRDYQIQSRKFWKRMREQGQEREAKARFDQLLFEETHKRENRYIPPTLAERRAKLHALSKVNEEFPFDLVRYNKTQKKVRNQRKAMGKSQEEGRIEAKNEEEDRKESRKRHRARTIASYVSNQLKGKGETTLLEDIAWARQHMHEIGIPDDIKTWLVKPKDAPSASAWNMLMYAVTDTKDFTRLAINELTKYRKEQQDMELALKKAEAKSSTKSRDRMAVMIDQMLEQAKKEAQEEAANGRASVDGRPEGGVSALPDGSDGEHRGEHDIP